MTETGSVAPMRTPNTSAPSQAQPPGQHCDYRGDQKQ
jgi:hypothetical protein